MQRIPHQHLQRVPRTHPLALVERHSIKHVTSCRGCESASNTELKAEFLSAEDTASTSVKSPSHALVERKFDVARDESQIITLSGMGDGYGNLWVESVSVMYRASHMKL